MGSLTPPAYLVCWSSSLHTIWEDEPNQALRYRFRGAHGQSLIFCQILGYDSCAKNLTPRRSLRLQSVCAQITVHVPTVQTGPACRRRWRAWWWRRPLPEAYHKSSYEKRVIVPGSIGSALIRFCSGKREAHQSRGAKSCGVAGMGDQSAQLPAFLSDFHIYTASNWTTGLCYAVAA